MIFIIYDNVTGIITETRFLQQNEFNLKKKNQHTQLNCKIFRYMFCIVHVLTLSGDNFNY